MTHETILAILPTIENLKSIVYLRNASFLQSAINVKTAVITNIIPIGSNVTYYKI